MSEQCGGWEQPPLWADDPGPHCTAQVFSSDRQETVECGGLVQEGRCTQCGTRERKA